MKFLFSILMLVFFNTQAFSCALCALMTPTAHIFLNFKTQNSALTKIEVSWYFSDNFTNLTKQGYDFNSNSKLEPDELKEISFAMLSYVKDKNFLMNFEYYDMPDGDALNIEGNFTNPQILIENSKLVFKFEQNLNIKLQENRVFKIIANDENKYFNFTFLNADSIELNSNLYATFNSNLNATFASIQSGKIPKTKQKSLSTLLDESDIDKIDKPGFFEKNAINSLENLKALFVSLNDLNFAVICSIIFISFLYGFFHAAGPGHAKILTTSYFMANGGSYLKSFLFSLKIGFFHILGAFLLVVVSMFVIDIVANSLNNETIILTTKISAILIILIALFMLITKIKNLSNKYENSCGCKFCNTPPIKDQKSAIFINNISFKKNNFIKFKQNSTKTSSKNEWLIAFSSAIIPCPGTILVFLLAFNVKSYFSAFLSAFFMGLGMASVIFIAAIFGTSINKFTNSKLASLKIYVEFLGLGIMIILGVFMYVISDKLGIL
ncbi:DUF1007 family protein [Campylobacter sp. FMV-PI01]|uniref:Nickel/cobalt efflux system n=1 Tax=Campylobacter portucalensis TaxID=2608384 RepID=A0A6L5WIG8_9BACT|nr:DUF1007 family protein [Campylobacter portucalensis]MSN96262.1 DUF1007 family protein [Campylobacter portucalensis]